MNTVTMPRSIDDALARAVVYRTLSIGFQAPSPERHRQMAAAEGFPAAVAALDHLHCVLEDRGLASAAERLTRTPAPDVDSAAAAFVRLFGHTARGPVSACETEYGPDNAFNQPQQLANIAGYYQAFGLRPVIASEARVDHIACELEFMDFLNRKQARFLADGPGAVGDDETLDMTERAERAFLRDHLARFGRAFATRVAAEEGSGYFGALAVVLLEVLSAECARLDVEAGPIDLAVREDAVDDTPMACGSAESGCDERPGQLIQILRRRP
jgi:putative dimethyl sulfoxide reductase chaperone